MVGLAYYLGGRWEEAEELWVHMLETCKRVVGPEHPQTQESMGNLAETYRVRGHGKRRKSWECGCWRLARECLGRSIQTR